MLLFNIAAVLGPRWIAAAAHNGTSSISLWVLAALLFFVPTALIVTELSTRFPQEGGLYIWTREAFGDFHGFVAGWSYWVYTLFYFPGLLMASTAMSGYIMGGRGNALTIKQEFLVLGSLLLLTVAVWLNVVGLNVGKWLQNAGGVGTYVPLVVLAVIGGYLAMRHGSATHITLHNTLPTWDWGTVNFWSQIAFAFTGLELVCAMGAEVKNPRKTFPRAILGSGLLIAAIYIVGTLAVMSLMHPGDVDPKSGVFQAITSGSSLLGIAWVGVLCALAVTVGNAGGVGATVAGVSRVPFVAGIDNYLPKIFGKVHPQMADPVLVDHHPGGDLGGDPGGVQFPREHQRRVPDPDRCRDHSLFPAVPLYVCGGDQAGVPQGPRAGENAVLIPGGKAGVWIAGALGFMVTLGSMALACIPPNDVVNVAGFELKLVAGTVISIASGWCCLLRGARRQRARVAE